LGGDPIPGLGKKLGGLPLKIPIVDEWHQALFSKEAVLPSIKRYPTEKES